MVKLLGASSSSARWAFGLAGALPLLVLLSARWGSSGHYETGVILAGLIDLLGGEAGHDPTTQAIVELRLWRAFTAAGVGAALAFSGALVQGLFRNGLAAPSLLGVTSGASLGASLAILFLAGYGPAFMLTEDLGQATLLLPLFAFVGAIGSVTLVTFLASPGGHLSIPTLLLVGIAVNTCLGGLLSLMSWLLLEDWEVARSILTWTFGVLSDRTGFHAATVWIGVALCAGAIPFVSWELDLLAGGEEDARSLGVNTKRVRAIVLIAASLSAATAVSVSGQIAFVGLVVPHIVRQLTGASHRTLLPLSMLAGAVFLLGVDTAQRYVLGDQALQPGVMMSLVGGPFFLALLLMRRREIESW